MVFDNAAREVGGKWAGEGLTAVDDMLSTGKQRDVLDSAVCEATRRNEKVRRRDGTTCTKGCKGGKCVEDYCIAVDFMGKTCKKH